MMMRIILTTRFYEIVVDPNIERNLSVGQLIENHLIPHFKRLLFVSPTKLPLLVRL